MKKVKARIKKIRSDIHILLIHHPQRENKDDSFNGDAPTRRHQIFSIFKRGIALKFTKIRLQRYFKRFWKIYFKTEKVIQNKHLQDAPKKLK